MVFFEVGPEAYPLEDDDAHLVAGALRDTSRIGGDLESYATAAAVAIEHALDANDAEPIRLHHRELVALLHILDFEFDGMPPSRATELLVAVRQRVAALDEQDT